jgi:hypothetical protein
VMCPSGISEAKSNIPPQGISKFPKHLSPSECHNKIQSNTQNQIAQTPTDIDTYESHSNSLSAFHFPPTHCQSKVQSASVTPTGTTAFCKSAACFQIDNQSTQKTTGPIAERKKYTRKPMKHGSSNAVNPHASPR